MNYEGYSNLTKNGVSFYTDEKEQGRFRKSYVNSELGRKELQEEVEEPFLSEVMNVWGESPTVFPRESEEVPPVKPDPVQSAVFRLAKMQAMTLSDEEGLEVSVLFPAWAVGIVYKKDDRFTYQDGFYKVLQEHTSQAEWLPDNAPSLYVMISDPSIEYPEWKQPTGAHDAYYKGDKVSYQEKNYISQIDGNTTVPGTDERWWKEVTEKKGNE